MKLGITAKLFLAVLTTSVLVALAMGIAARVSFTHGFLGYLNDQGVERVETIVPSFTEAYVEHGSWDFLRDNPRAWFRLIRPRPAGEGGSGIRRRPPPTLSDMIGVNLRVALLDAERRLVIGNPDTGDNAIERPLIVDGQVVGFLAVVPFQQVSAPADVRFQEQQNAATWVIGALSVLLAALVAVGFTRRLLAPLKRIAAATHRLAAGDYDVRVPVPSSDEVGRLAGDFNQLALVLGKNEEMRRGFMADVSHELRTPLAVLHGEIEALEDGVRLPTPTSLASLKSEVGTLNKLVDDLYELALCDAGALAYRMQPTDLGEVLAGGIDLHRQRIAARGLRVECTLPAQPLPMSADRARLQQLIHNLLENTLRYTDEGGAVRITCTRDGERARIAIEDSGPGVPEEHRPHLFERFYRVESSRNRASGGAGLGLAICRNVVEAHGGSIEAQASPLGGLRIAITLHLAP